MSKRIKVEEDAVPMSVGGGAVPSLTNPTDVYALQLKKRIKNNILRRKPPMIGLKNVKQKG